jgi:thiamine-phosphate pyrophosphorylase
MRTRLFLITPPLTDPLSFRPALQAALAVPGVSSLLLRFGLGDEPTERRHAQTLIPLIQERDVAALVPAPSDPRHVARSGADGAQLHIETGSEADVNGLKQLIEALKPDRIVGVGGVRTRDAAMTAGELGADYVMFGEPRADGSLPDFGGVIDRCAWWAEVFQVPCVGYAPSLDQVGEVARTGVEFVALCDAVWSHADGPAEALTMAQAAIDAVHRKGQ